VQGTKATDILQEMFDGRKLRNMVLTLIPPEGIIRNFVSDSYDWNLEIHP
jgi:hypothetical protein